LSDVNNLNKEIQTLKKKLTNIRARAAEIKENLTTINVELEDCDQIINQYRSLNDQSTSGDKEEITRIREELDKLTSSIKLQRQERSKVIARFKDYKRVLDWWKDVKQKCDYAKRTQEYLKKNEDRDKQQKVQEQERKKNQMNAHEHTIALAEQAKVQLLEIKRNSGKKVVMKMETIQLFDKLALKDYPSSKEDIDRIIDSLEAVIKKHKELNSNIE